MPDAVEIVEVGPRDGLQNEPRPIATADKVALVDCLSQAGFRRIEVASFVDPARVPQMADGAAVLAAIRRAPGVRYAALVPNRRGLAAALAAGVDEIAIFASASEGFSRANLNCSISESLDRFRAVFDVLSTSQNVRKVQVRGYVSCVTHCPWDGAVPPAAAARVAAALAAMGCHEISLGDTLGRATPGEIAAMLAAVTADLPPAMLAGHFHDTGGRALDNVAAAMDAGLRVFDAAAGGLGGCPFAPGAAGNLDTERLAGWLARQGCATGLDLAVLDRAAGLARAMRGPGDGAGGDGTGGGG